MLLPSEKQTRNTKDSSRSIPVALLGQIYAIQHAHCMYICTHAINMYLMIQAVALTAGMQQHGELTDYPA